MATENQKISPSSQAPIAELVAADTAANKSDAYTRDFDREAEADGMLIKLSERRKTG
jgi:hypothetical protein